MFRTTTSSANRGPVRRLALALTGACLAAASLTAAPVAEASDCYRFERARLIAHNTEESVDRISIKYLDVNHRVDMKQGGDTSPPDRIFCGQAFQVDLWEWDSGRFFDPHDYLGKITVSSQQAGTEQHPNFSGHGTNYELVYWVTPV